MATAARLRAVVLLAFVAASPAHADDPAPSNAEKLKRAKELDGQVSELNKAAKYSEAMPLAQESLKLREEALGPNHPDVAISLNNLADLYMRQGRLAEAELLFRRSLAIKEKILVCAPVFFSDDL